MKDQINTIRRAVEAALSDDQPYIEACKQALTALSQLEAMAGEPVALLVRKNSWNEGQWECGPPNSPDYGRQWADERMFVYAAPCASCDGTGSGGMGLGCTDCLGTGQDPSTAAPVAQQPQATCKTCGRRMDDTTVFHGPNGCFPNRQPQAEAVPPGYVLVPVDPTEAMCDAAMAYVYKYGFTRGDGPGSVYRAMIDAAIAQQKGGV